MIGQSKRNQLQCLLDPLARSAHGERVLLARLMVSKTWHPVQLPANLKVRQRFQAMQLDLPLNWLPKRHCSAPLDARLTGRATNDIHEVDSFFSSASHCYTFILYISKSRIHSFAVTVTCLLRVGGVNFTLAIRRTSIIAA